MKFSSTGGINGISVLICTYNGEKLLPETLRCLLNQQADSNICWEVILMDNASTDSTQRIALETWKNSKIPLHIYYEPKPGKPNALVSGFKKANYDIVCIIDDDNRVNPDYIVKIYEVMCNHPEVAQCGTQGIGDFEDTPPAWFDKFREAFAIGQQASESGYVDIERGYIYGAGCAIRKSVWFKLFDNNFSFLIEGRLGKNIVGGGEDSEISFAFLLMGEKLWYQDDILFKHFIPAGRLNWKYLKKMFFSFGISDVLIDFYSLYLGNLSKQRKSRLSNYWINTIFSLMTLLRLFPFYIYDSIFVGEGSDKILQYNRMKGYLLQLVSIRKNHKSIYLEIKNAAWRKPIR